MPPLMLRSTSPAKTFPKRRKDNEATFANSPIISIIPTKNVIGATIIIVGSFRIFLNISPIAFRLTYLLKVFHMPIEKIPNKFAPTTAIIARALWYLCLPYLRVEMEQKINLPPFSKIPKPPRGTNPSQLFISIKKKTQIAIGKIRMESARLFVTWSHNESAPSTITSKTF